ncbi:MAG: hypothetical protein GU355_08960 [Caldivirga sp.]|nr:hypothetical protein [Caldivirga sp.]
MDTCRLTLTLMVIVGIALVASTASIPLLPLAVLLPLLLLTKPRYCQYVTLGLASLLPLTLLAAQGTLPMTLAMLEELIYASLLLTRLSRLGKLVMALNLPASVALFVVYYLADAWRPMVDYVVYLIPLTSSQIVGIALIDSMMLAIISILIIDYLVLRIIEYRRIRSLTLR